ncbi:hypothetical protein LTR05_005687 [Lithohypha guttulata]|uniref:Malate dehydrogenase n=1 Tax=Lithohypha guttulata TaxID=1690604 RepID=A0AAN7Y658_9EURO|nr:hypothetical protein LTR05_005687 [Lithohypha guttulata]
MATETQIRHFDPTEVHRFARDVLVGNGVEAEQAEIVARCLVAADLRGIDTHGVNRIPSYMERIRQGVLDAKAVPTIIQTTPVVAQIDGHNGFGFLAASLGIDRGIQMAKEFGIGMVAVKHSNHFDMAPSIAARGKIYKAKRRGEKIPSDWALDGEGFPTDDPTRALEGVMLPMGGPKGSALAIMMDVFSGVLSGSAFAGNVTGPYDPSKAADVGHFLVVLKPDLFMSLEEFKDRMDYLYQRVVDSERRPDFDRIYFPGEIEQMTEEKRKREGIPYAAGEVETLNKEAEKVGVTLLTARSSE